MICIRALPNASVNDQEDLLQRDLTQEMGPGKDRQKFYAQLNLREEVAPGLDEVSLNYAASRDAVKAFWRSIASKYKEGVSFLVPINYIAKYKGRRDKRPRMGKGAAYRPQQFLESIRLRNPDRALGRNSGKSPLHCGSFLIVSKKGY